MKRTKEFRCWDNMIQRCTNPKHTAFRHYGGRGIGVCGRWMTFANFLTDMGPLPDGLTLERDDVNGNYEPGNCRWATHSEQVNNRRNNIVVVIDGISKTLKQWAKEKKLNYATVWARVSNNWNPIDALTLPVLRGPSYKQRQKL